MRGQPNRNVSRTERPWACRIFVYKVTSMVACKVLEGSGEGAEDGEEMVGV